MNEHPVRYYVLVWVALLVLLALTTASAYAPLGNFHAEVNLGIAAMKALLVAAFFMHLRSSTALVRIVASAAIVWLAILTGLGLTDFLSRVGG